MRIYSTRSRIRPSVRRDSWKCERRRFYGSSRNQQLRRQRNDCRSHVELSLRICTDLWAFFPWESVKIVPLLRKDNCRSARIFTDVHRFSVQIFQENFFQSFLETVYFLGFFKKYFCWPRLSQLKLSIIQKSWAGKFLAVTVISVSGEYSVLVLHDN